jgi:putative acyl-CoA dehydrogenase
METPRFAATHEVVNQVPPLASFNAFDSDVALSDALGREDGNWHADALSRDGAQLTEPDVLALAELANRHAPELFTHSPRGERIDALEFHPSWHRLLELLRREGLHALPYLGAYSAREGAMPARCAGYYLHAQLESGSLCPMTMTFASIPVLQKEPALYAPIRDKLLSCEHDARDVPLALKTSMLVGMGMTEKQGGSDVRTNRTRAFALDTRTGRAQAYRLVGHKWFFSVPQSDAHLVLARTGDSDADNGPLSCFYVPRFAPDGSKNRVNVQRLKNKVGNRSNASSEVEFLDAYGVMVGDEGRGVPTIIEMANTTRLDCVIGSAALMRAALIHAIHHARHRQAFGRCLADQPLMRSVLADLALESEAATRLFMRLARAFEQDHTSLAARAWRRIVTPAAKFWVCKRALEFTGEAMEVWGGNGYVEEGPMGRFYREAPVNSIWEGSGNVMCLDVLRALEREPQAAEALLAQGQEAARDEPRVRGALQRLVAQLRGDADARESLARQIAQRLVLIAQAIVLMHDAPGFVAEAFIATRLGDAASDCGRVYGTLPAGIDANALIDRAFPGRSSP